MTGGMTITRAARLLGDDPSAGEVDAVLSMAFERNQRTAKTMAHRLYGQGYSDAQVCGEVDSFFGIGEEDGGKYRRVAA